MAILSDANLADLARRRLPLIGRPLARRAAARALHAPALAGAPDDVVVLALLGLFVAASQAPGRDRTGRLARMVAEAALGGPLPDARNWPPKWRRRLAAAIAPAAPRAAAGIVADPSSIAACLLAAGEYPSATEWPATAEAELLRAALARGADRAVAINACFARSGLAAPLAAAGGTTLDDYDGGGGAAITAGPLVSVVVPLHDNAATIAITLRSLQRQRWRMLEILVSDDRSRDDGPSIVRDMAAADARIRLLESGGPPGASGARNTALAAATGQYIAFLDADDWSHPERIAQQVAMLRPTDAATVSAHYRIDESGRPVAPRVFPMLRLCPISCLVRADAQALAGPFEIARAGADAEYLGRLDTLFGRSAVRRDRAPLTVASWRPNSISSDTTRGLLDRERLIYREAWMRRHAARLQSDRLPIRLPAS